VSHGSLENAVDYITRRLAEDTIPPSTQGGAGRESSNDNEPVDPERESSRLFTISFFYSCSSSYRLSSLKSVETTDRLWLLERHRSHGSATIGN